MLSRVTKRTKIGNDIRVARDVRGLPPLTAHTIQRVTYPNSAAVGKTVFDLDPFGEAGKEMDAVVAEVLAMLEAE